MRWSGQRLLGIFPHPDDETYAAGGLLARAAAEGAWVSVVCATRGEAGSRREPSEGPTESLEDIRSRELAAACAALGVQPPRFLDFPDGRLAGIDPEAATGDIESLLRQERPHVVVTLGPDGVYGHRDHLAVSAWVEAAVRRLPDEEAPRLLQAVFPRGLFAPLWRALRGHLSIAPEIDGADLGVAPDTIDLRLDLGPYREAKLRALEAHATQLKGGDPRSFLMPGLIDPLLQQEWFVVAAGPPLPRGTANPFAVP